MMGTYWGRGFHMYGGINPFGFGIFFSIIGVVFFILLILLFVKLMHDRGHDNTESNAETETALDILKKRYAKGEITKKEFEEIKKDIEEK